MHPDIIIASIAELRRIRLDKGAIDQEDKLVTARVKDYMQANGLTEIWDDEISLGVGLQERHQSGTVDLRRLATDHPDIVVELALAGALKASLRDIDRTPYVGSVVDYVEAGGVTYALTVKEAN